MPDGSTGRDSGLPAFCDWLAGEIAGANAVDPGPYRLWIGLAIIAGGEVARLRAEGYEGEVLRDILHDEHSLGMACRAFGLSPGMPGYEEARRPYGLAVEAALELFLGLEAMDPEFPEGRRRGGPSAARLPSPGIDQAG